MWLGLLEIGSDPAHHVALAPAADELGYTRYWIAEHQPQPSPMLAAAVLAGLTDRIRIGTAGVLLHYLSPWRVAHDFHFLERVYPGRIDAGFCGGISPIELELGDLDGRDMHAIQAAYPARVASLVRHLRNTAGARDRDPASAWAAGPVHPPQIWSLGSSPRSADLAAEHGLAFGYALMFASSVDDPAAMASYRARFVPRGELAQPLSAVAVAGVCAESDHAALALAAEYPGSYFSPRVVGSPATCAAALEALRRRYRADEVVFTPLIPDLERRLACVRLLADALGGGAAR